MTAWRKDPPTVDEVRTALARHGGAAHWWWRADAFPLLPWSLVELTARSDAVHFVDVFDNAPVDEPVDGAMGEWAPCLPPDSASPLFPPDVMEAARETIRIAESTVDPIEVADAGLALARLVLGACPHALATSRLADGTLAPDEDAAAREHVAGCGACRETVETAGQLAALADASNH